MKSVIRFRLENLSMSTISKVFRSEFSLSWANESALGSACHSYNSSYLNASGVLILISLVESLSFKYTMTLLMKAKKCSAFRMFPGIASLSKSLLIIGMDMKSYLSFF